ncbi:MAG: TIM barrel protein [Clostridia bacterium]|nr:TIM barrel protein [Clostridia bacterium]
MQTLRSAPAFGPAGSGSAFAAAGGKHTKDLPAWLKAYGLDAFEYQGGNGIRGSDAAFSEIGEAARAAGILVSLHAPYFISLSGVEEETRLKSVEYIRASVRAAELLGADRIVIHTGSAAKISREEAMRLAADTLSRVLTELGEDGVKLGLETMGKVNQLGTPEEVLSLCKLSRRLVPVYDFGHINAREGGGVFPDADAFRRTFDRIAAVLGDDAARNLHCHFSRIEWTAAGEKRHLNFEDAPAFGPDFEPFIEAIARENLAPRVICESAGKMADDALTMKRFYLGLTEKQEER